MEQQSTKEEMFNIKLAETNQAEIDEQFKAKLDKFKTYLKASLDTYYNSNITAYETEAGFGGNHIDGDNIEAMQKQIGDLLSVAIYLAYAFGHEMGSLNDRHRVEAIFTTICSLKPERPTKEAIYEEIVAPDKNSAMSLLSNQDYRIAAYNRGYNKCVEDYQESIKKCDENLKGSIAINEYIAMRDEIQRLPPEICKEIVSILNP